MLLLLITTIDVGPDLEAWSKLERWEEEKEKEAGNL